MDLENQLLETLIESYIKRGIPIARALDNPLFERMPLASKIAVMEKYKDQSPVPSMKSKNLGRSMLVGATQGAFTLGGLGGLATIAADGSAVLGKGVVPKLLLAAGVGAGLGSILPLIALKNNKNRDLESQDLMSKNKYLEAIAVRSMSKPETVPGLNVGKFVDLAGDAAYKAIHNFQPIQPSNKD